MHVKSFKWKLDGVQSRQDVYLAIQQMQYSLKVSGSNCRHIANVQNHGFILVLDLKIVFIVLLHILSPHNKIRFSALHTVDTR